MRNKWAFLLIGVMVAVTAFIYHDYSTQERQILRQELLEKSHVFLWKEPFEELYFHIDPKNCLHALHFTKENSRGVVLFFHGRGKSLRYWGKRAQTFLNEGFSVFMIDYRGFGKSIIDIPISESTLLQDGEIAFEWAKKLHPDSPIVIYGYSLGTGVAAHVASKFHSNALLLEAPYFNLIETASYTKPYIPHWMIKLLLKYHIRVDKWIANVDSPVYIFHGKKDTVIPYDQSIKLVGLLEDLHKTGKLFRF